MNEDLDFLGFGIFTPVSLFPIIYLCISYAPGIHSGGLTLHQLVENMADYLPSKDEVVRGRGNPCPTPRRVLT